MKSVSPCNRHKKKAVKGGWGDGEASLAGLVSEPIVTTIESDVTTKSPYISCDICNKLFNSQGQYDEHIASKKHSAKTNGAKNQGSKRFFPYRKKAQNGVKPDSYMKSLSSNFIPGGYENYT